MFLVKYLLSVVYKIIFAFQEVQLKYTKGKINKKKDKTKLILKEKRPLSKLPISGYFI